MAENKKTSINPEKQLEGQVVPKDEGSGDIKEFINDKATEVSEVFGHKNLLKIDETKINQENLISGKGLVKFISDAGDNKMLFITPDNGDPDVVLNLNPTYSIKVEGNGNVADKSQPEYTIDIKNFNNGDEVEFTANTNRQVISINKIEK